MADLTFLTGRPDFDWQFLLRDVLAGGTFTNVGSGPASAIDLEWIDGARTIFLHLTGSGINAVDANTLDAGTLSGFSLSVDDGGGATTVMTMTGLTLLTSDDFQAILDGVTASTDPKSPAYRTLTAPMLSEEAVVATGSGDADTIFGSALGDTLSGGSGADTLSGGDGADHIDGGAGYDLVSYRQETTSEGGTGTHGVIVNLSDVSIMTGVTGIPVAPVLAHTAVDAHTNVDTLTGVEDAGGTEYEDILFGNEADNYLYGAGSSDILHGAAGDDYLSGDDVGAVNHGDDRLYGEDGNDRFKGGDGADYIDGGNGYDFINYDLETTFGGDDATRGVMVNLSDVAIVGSVAVIVAAHTAVDTRGNIDTLISIEDIDGTEYNDTIVGNDSENYLKGNAGDDVVRARGGGYDLIFGGSGADQVYGDAGWDDLDFSLRNSNGITVNLLAGTDGFGTVTGDIQDDDAVGPLAVNTTFQQVERVIGSDSADTFTAVDGVTATTDSYSFDGSSYVQATGMDGADNFVDNAGGRGVLMVMFDPEKWGHTRFEEGGASAGPWGSQPGEFGVIVNLSAAAISVDIGYGLDGVAPGLARDTFGNLDHLDSVRSFVLTDAKDYIAGGSLTLLLNARGGDDIVVGGSSHDAVGGGDGDDTVWGSAGDDDLWGDDGNDHLDGGAGRDWLEGGIGNDTLNGGDGDDTLTGDIGTDSLRGGLGNDLYVLDDGADSVVDIGGIDTVTSTTSRSIFGFATVENLTLLNVATALNGTGNALSNIIAGNNFANTLIGGSGGDTLIGLNGNDVLIGGGGVDKLTGGTGADFFVFNAPLLAANRDTVTDFNHVADTFRLENAVMTKLGAPGALKANFFFAGAAAHDADDHIIYNKATGGLFYDANGIAAGGVIQLATLTNKPALLANDFVVI